MKIGDSFKHDEMQLLVKEWRLAGYDLAMFTTFVGRTGMPAEEIDKARTVNVLINDECHRIGRLNTGEWVITSWTPGKGWGDGIPWEALPEAISDESW